MNNPARILVADDNETNRDILATRLEANGYEVLHAADGEEALAVTRERRPDLILLDIMMPGMDGYTVFDNLKKDQRTREVPVVMLTAKAIILHTPKDFFYGLYGFLAKPFSKQQLLKVVSEALRLTKAGESGLIPSSDGEVKTEGE
jgi:CheY-like chemotaxis protein